MMQCLVVEDQKEQAQALSILISNYIKNTTVYIAASISEALQLLTKYAIDLFFLDIMLTDEASVAGDGIELGKLIHTMKHYQTTPIIYVTSYSNRMEDAINDVHCFGFLRKPYTDADVYKLLDSLFTIPQNTSLQIRTKECIFREISFSNLLFIRAKGKYMTYHTLDACHTSRQYTMQALEEILPSYFVRCHKSYLINQHFFSSYDAANQCILLENYKEPIPVGRNYKDCFNIQKLP